MDLKVWTPKKIINTPNDTPGTKISAEYWTKLWRLSIEQGDYGQDTIEQMLSELYDTVWHETDAANTVSVTLGDDVTNVGEALATHRGQLAALEDKDAAFENGDVPVHTALYLDGHAPNYFATQSDFDVLHNTVDNIQIGVISAYNHNDLANTDAADAHPISSITDLDGELSALAAEDVALNTALQDLINTTTAQFEAITHDNLLNRDMADSHPSTAISHAGDTLATKLDNIDVAIGLITGGISTISHDNIIDRNAADQHTIAAISGLQAALDAKQNKNIGTANRVMVTNSSGNITVSGITTTQLNYLSDGNRIRRVTAGTKNPSGGTSGDVYIKYA